jgi:hypothetical protein
MMDQSVLFFCFRLNKQILVKRNKNSIPWKLFCWHHDNQQKDTLHNYAQTHDQGFETLWHWEGAAVTRGQCCKHFYSRNL